MRVLLYIEPHPIRDTLTHFNNVARKFLPLLSAQPGLALRIFANDATFAHPNVKEIVADPQRLIRSTPTEEDLFAQYLSQPWDGAAMGTWLDLMSGRGEVTEHYLALLRRIWNEFPFEVILHWGENGAITRFLDERPVTRVAMELGCTRPPFLDSIVLDPFGTNGSGVMPKLGMTDLREIVDNRPMSRHEALFGHSGNIAAPGYALQFQPAPDALTALRAQRKLAFLPLQLYDDANLLRFSPYDTVSDVVLDVVPRLAEAGYHTVIKPHPASKLRKGSVFANAFAQGMLKTWSDRIHWLEDGTQLPNARLFALADLVVTVNSSVGFEALYYDKPVVVLGDAVYKPRDMFPSLDDVLSGRFDAEAFRDDAGILRRFVLGGYLQPETILQDPSALGSRIGLMHQLWQRAPGDPKAFASGYWNACAPAQMKRAESAMFWGVTTPATQVFAKPNPSPAPGPDRDEARAQAEQEALAYRAFARRLRDHWDMRTAIDWLTERWTTPEGRAEAIAIGGMVDPDHYLDTYPDVRAAGIDPAKHFASSGLSEGRSPRAGLPGGAGEILARLQRLVQEEGGGKEGPGADDPDRLARNGCRLVLRRISRHLPPQGDDAFLHWLAASWRDAKTRIRILQIGQIVDPAYYLETYSDVRKAGVDPVHHFANSGIAERRRPRAALKPANVGDMLARLEQAAQACQARDELSLHSLSEAAARAGKRARDSLRQALSARTNRIAVVAHLCYIDLIPDILDRLGALPAPFDLIVTMPDWGNRRITEMVRRTFPDAIFHATPDRGRDIGPFIDLLPELIAKDYDAVLKVQGLRGWPMPGGLTGEDDAICRHETCDALLGSAKRVDDIVTAFRTKPQLNMIGPEPFLLPLGRYPHHDDGALAEQLIGAVPASTDGFFAGATFWLRPSCLKPLTELTLAHFSPDGGTEDDGLTQLVERIFGQAASARQGRLATAPIDPDRPLGFLPTPVETPLRDYLETRRGARRGRRASQAAGALIW